MRSFNFGPLEIGEASKIVGYALLCEITYTGATSLVLCIANGSSIYGSEHSEIVDEFLTTITRVTLDTSGIHRVQINGLTPGSYVSLMKISGDGSATLRYLTGSEA